MDEYTIPRTFKKLRKWLLETEMGRDVMQTALGDALDARCRACPREFKGKTRVLVVLQRLGDRPGVVVYADPSAVLKSVELPDVPEDEAEKRLEWTLPVSWKDLLLGLETQTHSDVFRGLSLETFQQFAEMLDAIHDLREIGATYGPEPIRSER